MIATGANWTGCGDPDQLSPPPFYVRLFCDRQNEALKGFSQLISSYWVALDPIFFFQKPQRKLRVLNINVISTMPISKKKFHRTLLEK